MLCSSKILVDTWIFEQWTCVLANIFLFYGWDTIYRNENYNSEEIVSVLSSSFENDVEALLGPGFLLQLPNQPLQLVDISFVGGCSSLSSKSDDGMEE